MSRRFSLFISFLFHPVFINLLSLGMLFVLFPSLRYGLQGSVKLLLIAFIFVTTGLLPAVMIGILKLVGRVSSIMLQDKEERMLPYLITATLYLGDYWLCKTQGGPGLLSAYLLACASVTVMVLIINFYFKVSIHMASLGALIGVVAAAWQVAQIDVRILIAGFTLLTGLTASARLFYGAHEAKQLYPGFIAGFAIMFFIL